MTSWLDRESFDVDKALDAAMTAFWERGYEAAPLADLMQAMGLQKGSIYKAFGDKHSLFMNAVERYLRIWRLALQVLE